MPKLKRHWHFIFSSVPLRIRSLPNMTAALNLRNCGRSVYDTLLRQGGGRPFNLAPFPPVLQSQFDCGTIFTLVPQADGTSTIRTFDISGVVFSSCTTD